MNDGKTAIYLVPLVDVNWLVYAPFDPARDFRVDPPKVEQSVGETRQLVTEMRDLTGGKVILTPHSGTYCRTGYYEGAMLDVYRETVEQGGEIALHLHEEIKGAGTRYDDRDHMRAMLADCDRRLRQAGVAPVAYRGGHYAYHPFMNELLPEFGVFADYSCAPGMDHPDREAIWTHAATSAGFLPDNPRLPAEGQPASRILEIPIGADGEGFAYRNLLHVEQSDLDNLQRVWDVIRDRADATGRPQIVHSLFHTGSVGREDWMSRFRAFLDMVPRRNGAFVTTAEVQEMVGQAVPS